MSAKARRYITQAGSGISDAVLLSRHSLRDELALDHQDHSSDFPLCDQYHLKIITQESQEIRFHKAMAVHGGEPRTKTIDGPLSPIQINPPLSLLEASSARVGSHPPDQDISKASSEDMDNMRVTQKPRLVSDPSTIGRSPVIHSPWTEKRSSSPRIVTSNPDRHSSQSLGSTLDPDRAPSSGMLQEDMESSAGFQYHHQTPVSEHGRPQIEGRTSPRHVQRYASRSITSIDRTRL